MVALPEGDVRDTVQSLLTSIQSAHRISRWAIVFSSLSLLFINIGVHTIVWTSPVPPSLTSLAVLAAVAVLSISSFRYAAMAGAALFHEAQMLLVARKLGYGDENPLKDENERSSS